MSTSPIVFLHGAGGSARQWQPVTEHLRARVCAIAIDLPGHGTSTAPMPIGVEEAVSAIDRELRLIDRPLTIVGHSLGGFLALSWALAHPRRVHALAVVASAARLSLHPEFVAQAKSGQFRFDDVRASCGFDDRVARIVHEDLCRLRLGRESLLDSALDVRDALHRVRVPTMVVVPTNDVVISPRHGRAVAAGIPGARLRTIEGSHYVHLERPCEVARALDELLSGEGEVACAR